MIYVNLLILFAVCSVSSDKINMTEYYQMPKLNLFHDYDRCMQSTSTKNEAAVYCFVDTTIKPNASNSIWKSIEAFSADHKHHFRHDILQRGLCIKTCKELLERYDYYTQMKYYLERFDTRSEVHLDPNTYANALDQRVMYNKLVNKCVNFELRRQYDGLMGYSAVQFCTTSNDDRELDTVDNTFIAVTVVLLLVVVCASVYDLYLDKCDSPVLKPLNNHYKQPVNCNKITQILLAFSLPRNWLLLVTPPKGSTQKDLRFIEAIRFLTMFGVLVAHSLLLSQVLPISNPEYVENKYKEVITILILNGFKVIQTFFTISGFLQAIRFLEFTETHKHFRLNVLWKSIVYRYFRLLPVYGYIMFLDASLLIHIHDGPFWPRAAETQKYFCRNNWWTNILFINNYVETEQPCLQQTWYLAVDFQLFIIGMVLLLIIWRYPQSTRYVFTLALSIAWLIPAIVVYDNKFEGVVIIAPEESKNIHWFDVPYKKTYIATHTNMGSYLTGLVGGYIYKTMKADTLTTRRSKALFYAWYAVVPLGLGLVMSGHIFYAYDFAKPSWWMAIYASASINLWGVLVIILFIGMTTGVGKLIRSMMNSPIFMPLGRLTYCTFLCHTLLLRCTTGDARTPPYLTDNFFVIIVMSTLVLSYLMAAILYLCIELPVSNLQKMFVRVKKEPAQPEHLELAMHD